MNKYIFANQLRGIAAILVVMTHYFGTYFAEQSLLASRTFSPDLGFQPAAWVHYFELPYQGPFGVAVFFLISGFVIPFSLRKTSTLGFLVNRVLRIFPTYVCCLALGTLAIWLSARYWGLPFSYDGKVLATNALLVHNLLNLPSMDSVNWTLSIEIKFYLLAALFAFALFRKSAAWLLGFLALAAGVTRAHANGHFPDLVLPVMELNYGIFMVIGVLFHQHVTGLLSTGALARRVLAVLAVFSYTWSIGPQKDQFPSVTVWYYSALAVFALCYFHRERFKPARVLDFFADISYPLYCVHPLVGYCVLKALMGNGVPFGGAVIVALATAVTLAWLIHRTVETGSNELGRRWARRLSPQQQAPQAMAA
jgi:peptidoglycan/LPS O-acetylase OafA/YrhL